VLFNFAKSAFEQNNILKNQLKTNTVIELRKKVEEYKRSNRMISFNDMLSLVYNSLCDNNSSKFTDVLKSRFRCGIIDEFQDTDMIQWGIFKAIFIDNALKNRRNTLFIVGDPKQAIYGFRGADINAYFKARSELLSLGGNYYFLSCNWRSDPSIVRFFNMIFSNNGNSVLDPENVGDSNNDKINSGNNGWFSNTKEIKYIDSSSPPNFSGNNSEHQLDSINRVYLGDQLNGAKAKRVYASFIADEVESLVKNGSKDNIQYLIKGKNRTLNYGDIAILVKKRGEYQKIEEVFKKRSIPYTIYKKEGLYLSREALELSIIIDAIAYPDNQTFFRLALLTRFFGVPLEKLGTVALSCNEGVVAQLFNKWTNLSSKKAWPNLFSSIINETGIFTRLLNDGSGERAITNFNHIIQKLIVKIYQNDFMIKDISSFLKSAINSYADDEPESGLHRLETDENRVQIMTIHASKGLEFPVVFLAGGFSDNPDSGWFKFLKDGKTIFDLMKSNEYKDDNRSYILSEDERLFYVALTRTMLKIYIPDYEKSDRSDNNTILTLIKQNLSSIPKIEDIVKTIKVDSTKQVPIEPSLDNEKALPDSITERVKTIEQLDKLVNDYIIEGASPPDTKDRSLIVDSFSNISKKKLKRESVIAGLQEIDYYITYEGASTLSDDGYENDEVDYLNDGENTDKTDKTEHRDQTNNDQYPHGADAGILFHSIIESVSFKEFVNGRVNYQLIEHLVKGYIDSSYRKNLQSDTIIKAIFELIGRVINKKLIEGVTLSDIPENDIIFL